MELADLELVTACRQVYYYCISNNTDIINIKILYFVQMDHMKCLQQGLSVLLLKKMFASYSVGNVLKTFSVDLIIGSYAGLTLLRDLIIFGMLMGIRQTETLRNLNVSIDNELTVKQHISQLLSAVASFS